VEQYFSGTPTERHRQTAQVKETGSRGQTLHICIEQGPTFVNSALFVFEFSVNK